MKQLFLKPPKCFAGILLECLRNFPKDIWGQHSLPLLTMPQVQAKWEPEQTTRKISAGMARCGGTQQPLYCNLCDSMTVYFLSTVRLLERKDYGIFFFYLSINHTDAVYETLFKKGLSIIKGTNRGENKVCHK